MIKGKRYPEEREQTLFIIPALSKELMPSEDSYTVQLVAVADEQVKAPFPKTKIFTDPKYFNPFTIEFGHAAHSRALVIGNELAQFFQNKMEEQKWENQCEELQKRRAEVAAAKAAEEEKKQAAAEAAGKATNEAPPSPPEESAEPAVEVASGQVDLLAGAEKKQV